MLFRGGGGRGAPRRGGNGVVRVGDQARGPAHPTPQPLAWGLLYLMAALQRQLPPGSAPAPPSDSVSAGPTTEPGIWEPSRLTGLPAPSPPCPQQALPVPVCCAPLSRTGGAPGKARRRQASVPPREGPATGSAGLGTSAAGGQEGSRSPGPGKERSQLRVPAPPRPGDFPYLSLASSLLSGLASGAASRSRWESAEPSAWHSATGSNQPTYRPLQMLHTK